MPLIDLKTDLKSLRFGRDVPGGGTSLYTQNVLQPLTPSYNNSFGLPVEELGQTGGTDFILRGGKYAALGSAKDVSRLTRLFTGTNVGLSFTAKQNILGLTGQDYSAGGPSLDNFKTGFNSEGVYLPTSTWAQAGVNAFGIHGNKQGINPFPQDINILGFDLNTGGRPTYSRYMAVATDKFANKLVHLANTSFSNTTGTLFSYPGGPNAEKGLSGRTSIKFATSLVPGGARTGDANPLAITNPSRFNGTEKRNFEPGKYLKSIYNPIWTSNPIFKSTLLGYPKYATPILTRLNPFFKANTASTKYSVQTNQIINLTFFNPLGKQLYNNNIYIDGDVSKTNKEVAFSRTYGNATFTQKQIIDQISFRTLGQIQDFRKKITPESVGNASYQAARENGSLTDAPNYSEKNFETRVHLGDPGSKILNRSNYTKGATIAGQVQVVDKINAMYMYNREAVTDSKKKNDFVKFRFAVINPDSPLLKTFVHFRALFNGAIADSMSAGWESFKYLGRGEDFFQYNGFSRDVSFGFKVVAQSKPELSIMYQKLNYLQSTLAPNFSENGFMRGNIHQLTIGGYFYEQPGVITSLNYTLPEESTWEIGIPSNSEDVEAVGGISYRDPSVKELTHIVEVSVGFRPIHTFLPQTIGSAYDRGLNPEGINGKNNIRQRFIALTNDGDAGNNNDLYSKGVEYATNIGV
jgi:hypothetical protein